VPQNLRVAYLVSQYRAINHTFILREILALRSLGFDIQVIAIRGADRPSELLTSTERLEQAHTFTVFPFGGHFLAAHLLTALRTPGGYFAGILLACKMGGLNVISVLYHLIYFAEAVVAGQAARKGGYKHIHSHFSSTVALIAARIFNLGLSITMHGPDEFKDVMAFGMREKVARSRFIGTISNYARSQIMLASDPADWHKVEVCRLGVDPSVFAPGPRNTDTAGVFRIICVGRLAPVKAQRLLIAACQRLISSGWNLDLHLVGTGPDLDSLQAFAASIGISENVVFEGGRNQDEVVVLYRQSDVFAIASFVEGVPVVLMEAMATELPCVATWVNGIPELIRDREEGLLVAPSDLEGLAKAIETLLKDPALRRRLGTAGRQRVLRDYNLGANAASLAEVFRKYLSQDGSRDPAPLTLAR
jgi:colanic acid/amylovoran biosynthesis glycosyltransferase